MGTKWLSLILGKKMAYQKTICLLCNDNIVSRGLQRTSRKIGKIVTLYHRELDIRVSMHHDIIYESDQQNATV